MMWQSMEQCLRYVIFSVLLVMLASCSRGPDDSELHVDIQQRLDNQFSEQLFTIKSLTHKGTAPRLDGVDGIYVYYDLELVFLRDYNLTSWRGLNVGTLAEVLGATPMGIEGFDRNGNKKDDRLYARGRLGYYQQERGQPEKSQLEKNQQGKKWLVNTYSPVSKRENVAVSQTLDTPSPKAVLSSIRQLLDQHSEASRSERDRITLRELQRSLARIELGHAELDGYYTLGSGWPAGAYYKFSEAVVNYAKKQGVKIYNYSSEGSLENGYRLNTGRIDFALLQSDVAEVLYKGWIEEGQLPSPGLRAIATLWPEAVHVITLKGKGIKKLSDIEGKNIAIGSIRSGTRFTAARLWLAAGFERLKNDNVKLFSRGDSIAALETGEVDVIVLVGAIPDPAIQALTQRRDDVYFVPLDQEVITRLIEQNFAYYGQPIPAKTYPGQTQSVLTLGMAALLTTNVNTKDEVVKQLMKLIREGVDEIAQTFYHANFITYKTARLGISMPLHPEAKRLYEQYQEQEAAKLNSKKISNNNSDHIDSNTGEDAK